MTSEVSKNMEFKTKEVRYGIVYKELMWLVNCQNIRLNISKERKMLRGKIKVFLLLEIMVLILFALFSIQSIAKTEITLASAFEPGHILVRKAEYFKDIVETKSNGEIEVQLFVGGVMGSEEEITESVSIGGVEMQTGGGGPIKHYAPEYNFFNSPFIMRDWNHWVAVWNGKLGQEMREVIAERGNTTFLGVSYRGNRNFTSNIPIYTTEDVEGLKLRLPPIPEWLACWEEIGASTVPVALTELFGALQTGVADASEGEVGQIQSFHLDEVQKYLTFTEHMVSEGILSINKDFFDNLSKEYQEILLEAGEEACEWATQQIFDGETEVVVELQKKGMIVVIPDKNDFSEKVKPALEKLFEDQWHVTTWDEILTY